MGIKSLPSGTEEPIWESRLVKDIDFIKKHMRYPFSARTLAPTAVIGVMTLLILAIIALSVKNSSTRIETRRLLPVIFLFVPLLVSASRYIKTLKFRSIPASLSASENAQLIESFLKSQRLVTFRNPEVPEIFQIISKNVSAYKEQREVMIFIADEGRILINSHFTNSEFNFVPAAPHTAGMAQMLQDWIKNNTPNGNSDIVSINTF